MRDLKGLFVTGTDTGVGKTLLTCSIIRLLRDQGFDAAGFKPVATGEPIGNPGDAAAIHEVSGRCEPLEMLCPYRLTPPLAPTLAARQEGTELDIRKIHAALSSLCERHNRIIVEGVGGVLVPLDRGTLVVDLALHIGFPVLVVCRAGLGTINHTLLTLRELERAGLHVAGIVMNTTCAADTELADGSREEIERISGRRVIATMPYFGSLKQGSIESIVAREPANYYYTKSTPPPPPFQGGENYGTNFSTVPKETGVRDSTGFKGESHTPITNNGLNNPEYLTQAIQALARQTSVTKLLELRK